MPGLIGKNRNDIRFRCRWHRPRPALRPAALRGRGRPAFLFHQGGRD